LSRTSPTARTVLCPGRWLALCASLALAACATQPTPEQPSEGEQTEAPSAERRLARARELVEQDRPLEAVRIYRALAEQADATAAQRHRLRIAEMLFASDHPELALAWHRRLNAQPIPQALATRKRLVDARAAVERRQGVRALRLLPIITSQTPDELRARILAIRADAYGVTGQPLRGVRARIARADLLTDPKERQRNNDAIWNLLLSLPNDRLQELASRDALDSVLSGWIALARQVRKGRLGEVGITEALAEWRQRFPDHPAQRFSERLEERVVAEFDYPERIALLLPLSGRLSEPARAVRDGILAAYYDQADYVERPAIEIHDTGADGTTPLSAYRRAVDQGAELIIGPLAKSGVAALASQDSLQVPVLSLNVPRQSQGNRPHNLYQFGLLPEDEARQAAEAATQNDHFNAAVLTPSGEWGRRMRRAFRSRFGELGGATVAHGLYNPEASDHGRAIKRLLNLDASYARRRRVASTIGRSVEFEPRRRQDIGMVFTAAMPEQARLIKPQLEFHQAAKLPVYATSHVYTGFPDAEADWDMNGLDFAETPWLLDNLSDPSPLYQTIFDLWPQRHRRVPRLYALGIDAFSLVPHLQRLAREASASLAGRTGRLSIDADHRVHRKLRWARFDEGLPVPVPRPEAPVGDDDGGDGSDGGVGADVRERAQGS